MSEENVMSDLCAANELQQLSDLLYWCFVEYEAAEQAGQPVIELAKEIGNLRDRIAELRREQAILQPPAVSREANGDIIWA